MTYWTCINCGERFGEPSDEKTYAHCPYCGSSKIISG